MGFEITRVDVWAGEIADRPGALAEKLAAVQRAGANLDFVIVRPSDVQPRTGVLFVAPLHGAEQLQAAEAANLHKARSIHALRLEGPDRPGLGAGLAQTLAEAGLNIAGLSAAAVGDRALFYLRFGSEPDVTKAAQVLSAKLG